MKFYTVDEVRNLARQHTCYRRTYYVEAGGDGHFNLMKRFRVNGKMTAFFIAKSFIIGKDERQNPIHAFPEIAVEFK